MEHPRFSIIIPAHNAQEFIERSISSIREQTFTDYELIIVADKCTDNTVALIRTAGIHPIISDGGAPGLARNAGMDCAHGDYLLFLDADDWLLINDALSRINEAIEKTDRPHLLHYGFMWGSTPHGGIQEDGGYYHHVWSRAWHRNAIGSSRMVALPAGQDTAFTIPFMEKPGLTHGVYDFPLVQHVTDREGSVTYRHLRKKWRGDMSMMDGLDSYVAQQAELARRSPVPPTH